MRYILLFLLVFALIPPGALAEKLPNPAAGSSTAAPPFSPAPPVQNEYKNIKDAYLEEAQQFYGECQANDVMNQYYDCECLSVNYLDERIKYGSEKTDSAIILSIRKTCQDATVAAGETYSSCMRNGTIFPAGQEPEAYCACLGNTYARLFQRSGAAPSSKLYIALQARAHEMCRARPVNR